MIFNTTIHKRFLDNIKVNENGCWMWQSYKNKKGYGKIYVGKWGYQRVYTHRYSYLIFVEDYIPPKIMVCHRCDTPGCCSPFHLFLGTAKENAEDSYNKGRQKRAVHGSIGMYGNHECRCELCMEAMRDDATKYRDKNKAKLREYQREYKIKNADSLKEKQANYLEKTKDARKEKSAINYQKRKFELGIGDKRIATHGTPYMYSTKGCRCDACKIAGSEYSKKRLTNPIALQLKKNSSRKYKLKQKALKLAQKNIS